MFDQTVTVRGATVDEAIKQGLRELGITKEEADIHVISEEKRGLFGFGKQDAIVEVSRKHNLSYKELADQLIQTEERTTHSSKPTSEKSETESPIEDNEYNNNVTPNTIEQKTVTQITDQEEVTDIQKDDQAEEANEVKAPTIDSSQDDECISLEASASKVAAYIDAIIKEYGADSTTTFDIVGNKVTFNIETDKSGLVIGKHGKIINSLQILCQTLIQNYCHHRVNVLLNVGDYRDRRAGVLKQIAEQAAEEVLRTRNTVILDPLPAYERKQIHAHLAKYEQLETKSEGKEPNRFLLINYINH